MEKKELLFSPLGIARDLEPSDRQVRFTRKLNGLLKEGRESRLVTFKNERVRSRNTLEGTIRDANNQRVVDATWPL